MSARDFWHKLEARSESNLYFALAFLPASSVRKELATRKLVPAAPSGSFELAMDVCIYRERRELARHPKATVQALWEHLAGRSAPSRP